MESNDSMEVEGLLHGIQMAKQHNWTSLIAKGDSDVVLHMATKIHHGNSSTKVATSWRSEGRMEKLMEIMHPG